MAGRNWLILTALTMETKAIAAELGSSAANVHLQTIGIKAKHIDRQSVAKSAGIILAGIAGALDPTLSIGDLILDAPIEGPWNTLPFRAGKIHTADHLVTTVAEKQFLLQSTGCPAVDMEGQIVREIADAAKVPMIHLRAVSDRADEALPDRMSNWIDDFGEPRLTQVAADLTFRAHLIPTLLRLQKNSRLAANNAAAAVKQVLSSLGE